MVRLPDGVRFMADRGEDWAAFVDRLPRLRQELLDEWELTPDGWMMHGYCSLVVPAIARNGQAVALKIAFPDPESEHEHLALTHWNGIGAVRLLRADPRRGAILMERLHAESLRESWDVEACEIVAGLYRQLHIPAFQPLRLLSAQATRWAAELRALPRNAPIPRRYVEQAAALAGHLAIDENTDGTLIHADLHYDNVLAADREPWLAIDPKPLSGDPAFEPAPMLWNRYDELAGDLRSGIRRRFHTLVDAAELDEDRARDWVIVRMLVNALWRLQDPPDAKRLQPTSDYLTQCITIAKAVQD